MMKIPYRTYLQEEMLPTHWYNIKADMISKHDPCLNPHTLKPITIDDLTPIFCQELSKQELNDEDAFIKIPDEVYEYYKTYRPSPLVRAYNLEKALNTPARIYFKFEGGNTSGSHKLNSAVPQVYYAKKQGIQKLATETGAGQWGTALSMACSFFDMDLRVYMVKASAQQKPHRKAIIETFGGTVIESPSDTTLPGSQILKNDPQNAGSLATAISEAVYITTQTPNCRYVLGSVLDQVVLHQSIVGLEAKITMESLNEYPDIIIGCAGGGSNLGGIMAPFMRDKLKGKKNPHFIAVEPASCPSLTRGKYAYDYCDIGKITPLAKMYTLGSEFMPSPIHAGGLRYHGMSPIISKLYHDRLLNEARSVTQTQVFNAAKLFSQSEGILPAPESSHAIKVAIDEALKCKEAKENKVILFNLTGTGYFDMAAYMKFNQGSMTDYIPTDEDLKHGFDSLKSISVNN